MNASFPRLSSAQSLSIIENGLPKTTKAKDVVVLGAGMSGLVTASLLKEAGHRVTVIEARDRVGGRVYTMRPYSSDDIYLDMGAMRIPEFHHRVLTYVKKFGLPINPFLNDAPTDLIYVNGIKSGIENYKENPDILNYPVKPNEKGRTAKELLRAALMPILEVLKYSNNDMDWLIQHYGHMSMEDMLDLNPFGVSLSKGAIDMIKVLLDIEGFSELSFVDLYFEGLSIIFMLPNVFYEITGGNDHLPKAFLPQLSENLHLNERVTRVEQLPSNKLAVHTKNTKTTQNSSVSADVAVVTLPFSVLSVVELEPMDLFSYKKRKAIREVHDCPAVKIGIYFKTRFWEKNGRRGGKIITDLPIRFAYYPSHGFGNDEGGVILASYTWEDDATPWSSFSNEQRVRQAL
ncbi:MAG TPA: FAD-dependent oxidoreductase, partial [Bacillales bacterium]|nr:FAD-dependent oxidoreductase [Bacillales bacterium]